MANHVCLQRVAAVAAKTRTYFTGKPCKYGHVAPRLTADFSCTECRTIFWKNYRGVAAGKAKQRRDAALARDPVGARQAWADWQREARIKDPEKFRARDRKHGRIKRQRNPGAKLAEVRKRQADKIQRTPSWADLKAIRKFYEDCPVGFVVDHVIPLRGKFVSGLHVLENLQYLTHAANLAKGNRFDLMSQF